MFACGTCACSESVHCGSLPKGFYPVSARVSEKTTKNTERLGRQARLRIKPGTPLLPTLTAKPPTKGRSKNLLKMNSFNCIYVSSEKNTGTISLKASHLFENISIMGNT